MAGTIIDFDESEEEKINFFKAKWKENKQRTIKKIVADFKEELDGTS